MNKREIRQFTARNIGIQHPIPTAEDIARVIEKIESRLAIKQISMTKNYPVKEGYQRAIENIKTGIDDVSGLKTEQGRAIASCGFDYLFGKCSEETLCNIPIKLR